MFFLSPRTDDDPTTERKVASMLETVNKIKWKTAESVEGQEEEVRPGRGVFCLCCRCPCEKVMAILCS